VAKCTKKDVQIKERMGVNAQLYWMTVKRQPIQMKWAAFEWEKRDKEREEEGMGFEENQGFPSDARPSIL